MADFDLAVRSLHSSVNRSVDLQRGLVRRQSELLDLEAAHGSAVRTADDRVVIDRAEDIRRALRTHSDPQVSGLHDDLICVRGMIIDALVDRVIASDHGRPILRVVDHAARECERATAALEEAADALGPTAQAVPGQPDLSIIARGSVDSAAKELESARRAVFRVSEDLRVLVKGITGIAAETDGAHHVRQDSVELGASLRASGSASERRQPTYMPPNRGAIEAARR